MQLDVRRQGIDIDEESRERLQRRVDFALGRLGERVSRVWVHLAEESGIDKRCRVLVRLQQLPDVLVEDHDSNLQAVIDRAVNRAGLTVRRELDRRQSSHIH